MGKQFKKAQAPENRVQVEQDTFEVSETANKADTNSFIKKEVQTKGPVLKQEVIAEALSAKGAGAPGSGVSSAAAYGLKVKSFSGDTGTILGNASGTPSMGKPFQGDSRVDKRLSDQNKDINFIASEQVIVGYDAIPALADSESTVGYNGNPKNVAARAQKKTGSTSAEILYDRSLDIITKDAFVFSCGQVVKQKDVEYNDYPTETFDIESEETVEYESVRGNYSPRNLKVVVSKDSNGSYIKSFEIEEDDFSCNEESDFIVNQSATNHIIDMNRAELARQNIDSKAGSPTSPHFNPLGRSVSQPTATVTLLQDIENVTGAEVFASIKFANKARAHYLNRTAKDGQDLTGPAIDALYGNINGALDLEGLIAGLDLNDTLFSKNGMKNGSAALMIPIFDSIGKYKTKADIVNQPRGLKMHLQTAMNNSDPFRCKEEFVAALNSIDAYSTIDHDYDPTLPVYITDNVRLVHPYSWRDALKYTRDGYGKAKKYDSKVFTYTYAAGSGNNEYAIICGDPLLNGVAWFFEQHAHSIYDAVKASSGATGDITINIPIVHSTTHFSLWDLLVCASTPYIIYERTNTLKDILDFELFNEYPFMGNTPIKTANPLAAVNYGTVDPTAPIEIKRMHPATAIRWKYPEVVTPMGDFYLMPYYFNERGFDFVGTTGMSNVIKQNDHAEFTTPVVRSGMKLSGLDDFFAMEVKDQLLVTDRMTRLPGDEDNAGFKGAVYKYSQDADGMIVIHNDALTTTTVRDWCATPRLLGWYFDAPQGLCSVTTTSVVDGKVNGVNGVLGKSTDINIRNMKPSFTAIQYRGYYKPQEEPINQPLAQGAINVNRAQSFVQTFSKRRAGETIKGKYFDLILSLNEGITYNDEGGTKPRFVTESNVAQFSPFVLGEYHTANGKPDNTAYQVNVDDRPIVFSIHAMLWTLLQKTPFIINPFENSDQDKPAADPFSVAYVFGLAGFMSANYDEEIYNRANKCQYEGYGYVSDPMTTQSPVFKEGMKVSFKA